MASREPVGDALKNITILVILCILVGAASKSWSAHGDDILGLWRNEEGDAIIEVYPCREKYCGKIVWIKEPAYPADDPGGRAGRPRLDDNNPDRKLKKRPIVGLQIMAGFILDGGDEWTGGAVYDPKNGRTYRGRMSLVSKDRLHLRGYVLFSLFGRTTTWTRLNY